jgi:hypothetical protein
MTSWHENRPTTIEGLRQKFISLVEPVGSECLEWIGSAHHSGYGCISYRKKFHSAHRLAWQFAHGPIPQGLLVCHTCDNRRCVNIKHLFLGTYQDNVNDMIAKGRQFSGERKRLSFCRAGHPFDAENTYIPPRGGQGCRECSRVYNKNRHLRSREERNAYNRMRWALNKGHAEEGTQ